MGPLRTLTVANPIGFVVDNKAVQTQGSAPGLLAGA